MLNLEGENEGWAGRGPGRPSYSARFFEGMEKQRGQYEFLFAQYASWMFPKMPPEQRAFWGMQTFNFCYTLAFSEVLGSVLAASGKLKQGDYWGQLEEKLQEQLDDKLDELRKKTGMIATSTGLRKEEVKA